MTRAARIIDVLNARERARVPVERSTGLPYGWALWMKSAPLPGSGPVVAPGQVLDVLAARPPRPRTRGEELEGWRAFLALFRQGWERAPREERPLRAVSGVGSAFLHILFVVLLAWIAYLQSLLPPPPQTAGGGGGDRVGIGFVERGEGAASPGSAEATREQAQTASAGAVARQPVRADTTPAPAQAAASPEPAEAEAEDLAPEFVPPELPAAAMREPQPAEPAPSQLREREVALPEPVAIPEVATPPVPVATRPVAVREPELQVREREVEVVQAPTIQVPRPREVDLPLPVSREPELRQREVTVVEVPPLQVPQVRAAEVPAPAARLPELRQREVTVVEAPAVRPAAVRSEPTVPVLREPGLRQREVAEPLPQIAVAPPQVRPPAVEPRPAAGPTLRQRELPMPSAPVAITPPATPAPAPAAAPAPRAVDPAPAAASTASTAPAANPPPATQPSATPTPAPAPGSAQAARSDASASGDPWARALADDSWGPPSDNTRRDPGLFDAQGRARLPGAGEGSGPGQGPGSGPGESLADRGAPGGDNDTWTRERIEQAGTWLKRPPYDYEPTSFDRYWVPSESLLAEWVRKGIKQVGIPIPGTGKRINCVVSLLQLGGGCGISDPNLDEQPADGRPPPEIPFKPELQEDNGSVRP